jgi:hypothetical protein
MCIIPIPRHSHVDFVDWLADTTSFSVAVQFPPPPTRSWKVARRLSHDVGSREDKA